jgi:hypothetical protein
MICNIRPATSNASPLKLKVMGVMLHCHIVRINIPRHYARPNVTFLNQCRSHASLKILDGVHRETSILSDTPFLEEHGDAITYGIEYQLWHK